MNQKSIIKNRAALAESDLREHALTIAEAGLRAIDTTTVIREHVERIDDETIRIAGTEYSLSAGRVVVVGIGKCALEAARELERILGDQLSGGVVLNIEAGQLERLRTCQGDHPFPSERNIEGTKEIIRCLEGLTEDDLVVFVISGGGSTLLCQPQDLTCIDEKNILQCLFRAGASIHEINVIRKHLSLARGGHLARYAYPAEVVSLIFSDVPGNDLSIVASGPTVRDNTTVTEAEEIVARFSVKSVCALPRLPLLETPKDEKFFARVTNHLVVSNETALASMRHAAENLGYRTQVCASCLEGEARELGAKIATDINAAPPRTAHLYGGESTVTIAGEGKGGRNQELALAALPHVTPDTIVLPVASDGHDNGDVAGAVCDILTRKRAESQTMSVDDYLARNDSHTFFSQTGDQLKTGSTGTNVADLIIALHGQ